MDVSLVSVVIAGKQKFSGLSDEFHQPVRGLGQPDGKAFPTPVFVQTCLHTRLTFGPCVLPQITRHVGQCGPVAGTVDSAAVILCSQVVNSLVSTDPLASFMHQSIFIEKNVDPPPPPAGFCPPCRTCSGWGLDGA